MSAVQTIVSGSKVIAAGGGGGVVSGVTVALAVTSVMLFTTPAAPADAEFIIKVSGVIRDAGNTGNAIAPGVYVANAATDIAPKGFNVVDYEITAGPSAAISIPVLTTGAGAYSISYAYTAYRSV